MTGAAGGIGATTARRFAREGARAAVNARAGGGYVPLHLAAFAGDVAVVDALLAHGATADARADDGRTALAIAEDTGHVPLARRPRGEMP